MKVYFQFGDLKVESEWSHSKTAQTILKTLPISSSVNCWGDEIYFEISAKLPAENATLDVSIGDIAYWPEGACLCLFFGRTPASVDDNPKPASPVNLIGHFNAPPEVLRKIKEGTSVQVSV